MQSTPSPGAWISADGLVRVNVRRGHIGGSAGKQTTLSMDDLLFQALVEREGGNDEAIRWIRAAAQRVPALRAAGEPVVGIRDTAGLSRLVQRLVLQSLLTGRDFGISSAG